MTFTMEPEIDIPPPYSRVDISHAPAVSDSSTVGSADYSPTSTMRPTSSQSLRAPSFISLRGGYLRGVTFSDDEGAGRYFEERSFQFDPAREMNVIHIDITANTDRADLAHPEIEIGQDVTEQDWHTFVNYILTELGNETSSIRARKRLSEEAFHLRKTKLEELIFEWNKAFFQPRSIKLIAHYYYTQPNSPAPTYRSGRQDEVMPGLRRIVIEDGTEPLEHSHDFVGHSASLYNHQGVSFRHDASFTRGAHHYHHRGISESPPSPTGTSLGNITESVGRGQWTHHGEYIQRRRSDSMSTNSSKSSDTETETHHRRGAQRRTGDYTGRRGCITRGRRARSASLSSDSSLSSVSSISSGEISESTIGPLRTAIAEFRLDPTKSRDNRIVYRQLLQRVREEKRAALGCRPTDRRAIRKVSQVQRKAIRDDLKGLRTEIKQVCKENKTQRKAAQKQAQAVRKEIKKTHKESRKVVRQAEKEARKAVKNSTCSSNRINTSRECIPEHTTSALHNMPGSFPAAITPEAELEAQELEKQIEHLEKHLEFLTKKAARDVKGNMTDPNKRRLTRTSYEQEKLNTLQEITTLRNEISNLRSSSPTIPQQPTTNEAHRSNPLLPAISPLPTYTTRITQQGGQFERQTQEWEERFGRDMENWGLNLGRGMEKWGEEFAKRMSERGQQIGQRFG